MCKKEISSTIAKNLIYKLKYVLKEVCVRGRGVIGVGDKGGKPQWERKYERRWKRTERLGEEEGREREGGGCSA